VSRPLPATTFLVETGDTAWLVTVIEGRIARLERGPFLMRQWRFAVRASAEASQRFWESVPTPGYHDLFAMAKLGQARIEGEATSRGARTPSASGAILSRSWTRSGH
jgi:hypothetical protein